MSDKDAGATKASRRDFLKIAAAGAPVAAAASVVGAETEAEAAQPSALGMKKTEHVKKYLDSARF